jgi:hypothetical protein
MAASLCGRCGTNRVTSSSVAGHGSSYTDDADGGCVALTSNRGDPQREDTNVAREYFLITPIYNRLVSSSSTEAISLRDMILEAVRIVHQFSKYPNGVPREVHSRILQALDQKTISVPNLNEWSDGSMWMRILEAGGSENQKVTIFNILEYMGAWEWYDGQITLSQATLRTKKNKPVDRRGASIHVLNRMQGLQTRTEQSGKWVSGVERLVLGKEIYESSISRENCDAGITERARHLQRKRFSVQLSRGHKLSTKLVKELGLGILFSPKIW